MFCLFDKSPVHVLFHARTTHPFWSVDLSPQPPLMLHWTQSHICLRVRIILGARGHKCIKPTKKHRFCSDLSWRDNKLDRNVRVKFAQRQSRSQMFQDARYSWGSLGWECLHSLGCQSYLSFIGIRWTLFAANPAQTARIPESKSMQACVFSFRFVFFPNWS